MKPLASSLFLAAALTAADKPPVPVPVLPEIATAPTIDDPRTVSMGEKSVAIIHVCQLQNTIMVLSGDELARNAFVADKANWVIATTSSTEATHFLSIKVEKPLTRETTLNLVTNRNTSYTFRLVVGSDHCDSKVFIQPDDSLKKQIAETKPWAPPEVVEHLQAQIANAAAESAKAKAKADQSVEAFRASYPAKLRFDYKFDLKMANKMGIREIFHDGKFTYVSADSQEAPALYELKEGKPSLIAFSVKDGLYTTNKIVEAGYLAVGGTGNGKHQEKLTFKRVAAEEN
jgi:type IV secretion system protein VirB9